LGRVNPLRAHWTLDPEIRFLNHGSFGACPKPGWPCSRSCGQRSMRRCCSWRELERRVDDVRATPRRSSARRPRTCRRLNATTGVNAVLRSLSSGPATRSCSRTGATTPAATRRVRGQRTGARGDRPRPVPALSGRRAGGRAAAVTPRTRLALLDHVTSPTGLVFPIAELVGALRERGIETLVDGAHAPGMLALDLAALGAAYYTGNLHKWVCAPKGAAFLYVRRELQRQIRPTVLSHGANSPRTDRSRFRLEFDFSGTDDPSAFLCVPECLRFLGGLFTGGWDELRRKNRELALRGRALLCETLDTPAPAPEEMIGSLAAVPLPEGRPSARPDAFAIDPLQRALFERHRIEVPVFPWPGPPRRLVRISAQAWRAAEYAALAEALRGRA
jgi:isopenicillin-N epimerase